MLAGRPPFQADIIPALVQKIRLEAPPPFADRTIRVPEKLEALLGGANERIAKGDLFTEMGRMSGVTDGSDTDAYGEAEKLSKELIEKSSAETMSRIATARVTTPKETPV